MRLSAVCVCLRTITASALEAETTTRVDCGAADSEKAPAQARKATRTKERMVGSTRARRLWSKEVPWMGTAGVPN